MKAPVNEGRHWRRVIRGLAAILLASAGTAAVIAWMPSSIVAANVELVLDRLQAPLAKPGDRQGQISDAPTGGDARVRLNCAGCGVIVSNRAVGQLGGGVDPAAIVGLAGGAVMPEPFRRVERRVGY